MRKKQKDDRQYEDIVEFGKDDDYTSLDIASLTEVTGSVPRPPLTDAEAEGYSDIVSMPQQCSSHAGKQELRKSKREEKL